MKTKIKSHGDEFTDFHDKEISKVDSNHTCLAVISLDSALKRDEYYYPQVFLKECKYIKKKVIRYTTQDIEIFIDSTLKRDENYYPQVFLKECKYISILLMTERFFLANQMKNSFFSLMNA